MQTQELVEMARDDVPVVAGSITREGRHETRGCDHRDLVDGVQDQIEDAFLLEQILTVSQRSQLDLLLFVLCGYKRSF